jgi:hypothetical protein
VGKKLYIRIHMLSRYFIKSGVFQLETASGFLKFNFQGDSDSCLQERTKIFSLTW